MKRRRGRKKQPKKRQEWESVQLTAVAGIVGMAYREERKRERHEGADKVADE